MFKKFLSIALLIILATTPVMPVYAQQVIQPCKEEVAIALDNTMGTPDSSSMSGYYKQLSDLLSTNMHTHLLIDEVQRLARDARIELKGICEQVVTFENIDQFYVRAYDLDRCKAIKVSKEDTGSQLEISNYCQVKSDDLLETFLDSLRLYLIKQAIRTSSEPLVQRMRSLNARLAGLIAEYGRVVGNFYTFDFRLGDTIIGERD